ncbi:hypothetical protein B4N84_01620 [Flavobacterium sp. IR1]|nr:hypothetical protein B4N84_01620 [Flavobacterium sp. IR1]
MTYGKAAAPAKDAPPISGANKIAPAPQSVIRLRKCLRLCTLPIVHQKTIHLKKLLKVRDICATFNKELFAELGNICAAFHKELFKTKTHKKKG